MSTGSRFSPRSVVRGLFAFLMVTATAQSGGRSVKIKGYRVELYAAPTWGPPLVIMRSEPGAIRFSLSVYFWPFVFAVNGPIRRSPGVDLEYIDHQSPDYWG